MARETDSAADRITAEYRPDDAWYGLLLDEDTPTPVRRVPSLPAIVADRDSIPVLLDDEDAEQTHRRPPSMPSAAELAPCVQDVPCREEHKGFDAMTPASSGKARWIVLGAVAGAAIGIAITASGLDMLDGAKTSSPAAAMPAAPAAASIEPPASATSSAAPAPSTSATGAAWPLVSAMPTTAPSSSRPSGSAARSKSTPESTPEKAHEKAPAASKSGATDPGTILDKEL